MRSCSIFKTPTKPAPRTSRVWYIAFVVSTLACGCYSNVFGLEYETCAEVNAAMDEELATLQACSVGADCGQILEGTSCGCTNELVAHKDFDAGRFRALQVRANDLKCMTTITDCSCAPANGFVCTNNVCGWNYE